MIKKKDLENLTKLYKEKENLKIRIKKLDKPREILTDSVSCSASSYPYIKTHETIQGFDDSIQYRKRKQLIKKYTKMLKEAQYKIDKMILSIEYELKKIDNPEIREIIRLKYIENRTYLYIMHQLNFNSEEAPRLKLERFFQKIEKCTNCTV